MPAAHTLALAYARRYPAAAARRLESQPPQEAADLLAGLPPADAAPVLAQMLPAPAAALLRALPEETAARWLGEADPDTALSILRHVGELPRRAWLLAMPAAAAQRLRGALRLSEDTAGYLADPHVLTLPPDIPAAEALQRVQQAGATAGYYVYVVERDHRLAGVVTLKELLAAADELPVRGVMTAPVFTVSTEAALAEVLANPHWRSLDALPVVQRDGVFIGAVRLRELVQAQTEAGQGPQLGSLSGALVELWELYALTAVALMTGLANVMERPGTPRRDRPTQGEGKR